MLREFVEQKHCMFIDKADSWEEAIRLSCKMLEADGTVEENYAEAIIESVKKYGPYIVLMPNVAMPHAQEDAYGVNKTAIGFMKVEEPVSFSEGDLERDARLFFTLASCNPEQHLENMKKLSEMLLNEELVNELLTAKVPEDLLVLQEKYLD